MCKARIGVSFLVAIHERKKTERHISIENGIIKEKLTGEKKLFSSFTDSYIISGHQHTATSTFLRNEFFFAFIDSKIN